MKQPIKFGVLGTWRGSSLIKALEPLEEADVVAICDRDPKRIQEALPHCAEGCKVCKDFDELLTSGIDVVILANFFHEHAAYAIQAMEAGIHVLSECLPAVTMKECVELVEAVERTGCVYAMAENCPYTENSMELTRLYKSGILGDVVYAEGEYTHPTAPENANKYRPYADHWRNFLPKTYYLSHSIGPLMMTTDLMPRKVIGKVAPCRSYAEKRGWNKADCTGMMLVEMDGGVIFRVTGTNSFGPEAHYFRLACEKGGVETVRGTHDTIMVNINPWDQDAAAPVLGGQTIYKPVRSQQGAAAMGKGGHDGADYWTVWHFVQDLLNGRAPYMDVYRSVAIAAVGILGWRSALENSAQYDIPDFRDPAARDQCRHDDASPFPKEGNTQVLPSFIYPLEG